MGFRVELRAAAATLLTGYKATTSAKIQIYRGRPATVYPPTAFIEAINEASILYTAGPRQRTPGADIVLIAGLFDSEEAVDAQDAFVDDFIDYVTVNKHAAGGSTLVTIDRVQDLPDYQPDWISNAPFYYATRLTLGGLKLERSLI